MGFQPQLLELCSPTQLSNGGQPIVGIIGISWETTFLQLSSGTVSKALFFLSIGDGFYVAKNRPIGPSSGDLAHHVRQQYVAIGFSQQQTWGFGLHDFLGSRNSTLGIQIGYHVPMALPNTWSKVNLNDKEMGIRTTTRRNFKANTGKSPSTKDLYTQTLRAYVYRYAYTCVYIHISIWL